jgi:hypothetical protein
MTLADFLTVLVLTRPMTVVDDVVVELELSSAMRISMKLQIVCGDLRLT